MTPSHGCLLDAPLREQRELGATVAALDEMLHHGAIVGVRDVGVQVPRPGASSTMLDGFWSLPASQSRACCAPCVASATRGERLGGLR